MPKSREQRYGEYRANQDHEVGCEAFMTEVEVATKRRVEALEREYRANRAKGQAAPEVKKAKSLEELASAKLPKYDNVRG
ncbi:hypothetical protein [Grimontia marina]|uniref:Uncharacterized protein n=1 Tax=Grimontia marina TaxID=646534 RepID=A0A128F9Y2_9GAMM|nr:hypothetical protein [Grimontia marina]CZF83164.1 hypothetical protein GMA8713_02507 [Grimontia marina]